MEGMSAGAASLAVVPATSGASVRSSPGAAAPPFASSIGVLRHGVVTVERPPLPVPAALAPLLPDGLRRGATTVVRGSTSVLLTLLAEAGVAGAWATVVGQPHLGLLAAEQAGVPLDRLALVPRPGLQAPTVLAALIDGMDVVVAGPGAVLTEADRRRLSARARDRGAVLLSTQEWPGAGVVLTAEPGRWSGVGAGEGRLRAQRVRVVRTGRGSAASSRSVELTFPLSGRQEAAGQEVVVGEGAAVHDDEAARREAAGLRLVG